MNNQNNENHDEQSNTQSNTPLNDKILVKGVDLNKKLILAITIAIIGVGYVLTLIFSGNEKKDEEIKKGLAERTNLEQLEEGNNDQINPLSLPENYQEAEEEEQRRKNDESTAYSNGNGNSKYDSMQGESYFQDQSLDENAIKYDEVYKDYSLKNNNNNDSNNNSSNYSQLLEEKNRIESERIKSIAESRSSKIGFLSNNNNTGSNANNSDIYSQSQTQNTQGQTQQSQEDTYKTLNQQSNKKGFSKTESGEETWNLKGSLKASYSKYEVKAGSIIPATLITQINSDLPGNATAIVRESMYDSINGKYLLIPKGSKLIGEYSSEITFAQNRVMVVWQRLIMPNGKSLNLENMGGVDLIGMTGLKDKVSNHTLKLFQGVILSAMIGGSTDSTKDSSNATLYAQESASTVAGSFTEKFLNVQPTIIISQGTKFNIFVNKDMTLETYKD